MKKYNLKLPNVVFVLISCSTLYVLIYNILHFNPILRCDAKHIIDMLIIFSRYLPNEIRLPSKSDTREFLTRQ